MSLNLMLNKWMPQAIHWVDFYFDLCLSRESLSVEFTDANNQGATAYKSRDENLREKLILCLSPPPLDLGSLKVCFSTAGFCLWFFSWKLQMKIFEGQCNFLGRTKKKKKKKERETASQWCQKGSGAQKPLGQYCPEAKRNHNKT